MTQTNHVSDYHGQCGSVLLKHRLIQWVDDRGRPHSAFVHPDRELGDEKWFEGLKVPAVTEREK